MIIYPVMYIYIYINILYYIQVYTASMCPIRNKHRTDLDLQVAVGDAEMKRCTALVPPSAYKSPVESSTVAGA